MFQGRHGSTGTRHGPQGIGIVRITPPLSIRPRAQSDASRRATNAKDRLQWNLENLPWNSLSCGSTPGPIPCPTACRKVSAPFRDLLVMASTHNALPRIPNGLPASLPHSLQILHRSARRGSRQHEYDCTTRWAGNGRQDTNKRGASSMQAGYAEPLNSVTAFISFIPADHDSSLPSNSHL